MSTAAGDAVIAAFTDEPRRCKMGRWLDGLPADQRAVVDEQLAGVRSTYWITDRICTKLGFDVTDNTVARHRDGRCSCSR